MKFKNFLINLFICAATLFCGMSLVGVFQFFAGNTLNTKSEIAEFKPSEKPAFDINNPNSILPINYEEEKLSDPKKDETNEAMFDPEGNYSIMGDSPKGFEDFYNFTITNKNFAGDSEDENWRKLIAPIGFVEASNQYEFRNISIGNGKIQFRTKTIKGISYKFSGEFLIKGNFYTLAPDEKVLEGVLTKLQSNKMTAKSTVTFHWYFETSCGC